MDVSLYFISLVMPCFACVGIDTEQQLAAPCAKFCTLIQRKKLALVGYGRQAKIKPVSLLYLNWSCVYYYTLHLPLRPQWMLKQYCTVVFSLYQVRFLAAVHSFVVWHLQYAGGGHGVLPS